MTMTIEYTYYIHQYNIMLSMKKYLKSANNFLRNMAKSFSIKSNHQLENEINEGDFKVHLPSEKTKILSANQQQVVFEVDFHEC